MGWGATGRRARQVGVRQLAVPGGVDPEALCALSLCALGRLPRYGVDDGGAADQSNRFLLRVYASGRCQVIGGSVAVDFPAVIVEDEVVSSAKQDAVRNVRAAVVPGPLVDVVRFAPCGWPVAARGHAASIAGGHADALPFGEETLVTADVDALSVVVETEGDGSGVADVTVDGGDGYQVGVALKPAMPGSGRQVSTGNEDPHGRSPGAVHYGRVSVHGKADQADEAVGGDLLPCSRVSQEIFRRLHRFWMDEPGTATSR
jgi:hypothetical protein